MAAPKVGHRSNHRKEKHLTDDEINAFHLSTLKLRYADAAREYETRTDSKLGRLIAQRELPVLRRAKELLDGVVPL